MIMQDELIDDSKNDNPVAGLKGSLSLKDRFKYRLSRMTGRAVAVKEATAAQTISIYFGPTRGATSSTTMYDDGTRKFAEDLQCAMQDTARSNDGK